MFKEFKSNLRIGSKNMMKNGYYLSVYAHIDPLAHILHIDLRHDHHMVLWKKEDHNIEIVHYWEFERLSGIKHHNLSMYDIDHAKLVVNTLLDEYGLTLDDMVGVFGTPGLDTLSGYHSLEREMQVAYHSMAHLFSCLMMDTEVFYNENMIAIAADGGPDNVVDLQARDKDFYLGAFSSKGKVTFFSVTSPGVFWRLMKIRYQLQEGSLMALGTASRSECLIPLEEWLADFHPIKNATDIFPASDWFRRLAERVEAITDSDEGRLFNGWDERFSRQDNLISMVTKIIQDISFRVMDDTIREIIQEHHVDPADTYLALSGGFSLNCPANTFLMDKYRFKGLQIPPCVNDSGIAMGMGLYAFYKGMESVNFKLHHAYWGDAGTADVADLRNGKFAAFIRKITVFDPETAVSDIEANPVLWVSGRAEVGPRALGGRSILADPRSQDHKDSLNLIKGREWWRPVAPIILQEHVKEWFIEDCPTPYMLTNMHIREHKRSAVPAILHLDDTARVQSLGPTENIPLRRIIEAFYRKTGVPILCNTSLNDKGEPIVNRYEEALNFALRKAIRVVYLDGYRVEMTGYADYAVTTPEVRNGMFCYFHTDDDKRQKLNELNPFELTEEELIFYYNSPELLSYDLRSQKDVASLRRIMDMYRDKSFHQVNMLALW